MRRIPSHLALLAIAFVCILALTACGSSAPVLQFVTITPTSATINVGTTQQFSASAYYSDGSIKDGTSLVTWGSSNPTVATIAAGGVATAVGLGTTTITATAAGTPGATATLSVNQLLAIAVTPATATAAAAGATQQFKATGAYKNSDGTTGTADVTTLATWTSGTTAVATIGSGTGLATAVANGTSLITASLNGMSGTATFTVNTLPPTVTFTNPANLATGIPLNRKIAATLSKPMNPATITTATFTVAGGATNVAGTVTYNAVTNVATFAPMANLAANTLYTATVTTGATDQAGNSLASNYVWTFTTGATTDMTAPTVTSTNPASAATAVALNQKIAATFSKVMDSSTITTTTFTLNQGTTAVLGTVSYAGTTATFTPTANLAASTLYTATITTGAKDLAGNALASSFVWTFTTGTTTNISAPTVTLTVPADKATSVGTNQTINATFSTGMDPTTINTVTFTLAGPGTTNVIGVVTYDAASNIATFTPSSNLAANALFTATVTTGAADLAGNALASNFVWTFTTGATTTGAGPVNLGSAGTFAGAGGAAGATNQGTLTVINGDIGTTGASTTVTGFHDTTVPYIQFSAGCIYTETTLNVGTVNGTIYTAPPPPTTLTCPNEGTAATFAIATQALADAQTAFNTLKGMPGGPDPGSGQLGGLTLAPGVYTSASGSFMITGSDLTLDAKGDANAVWVFQMASTLTVGAPGAPRSVILINGAQAKNVYWQVGSAATINGAGGGTMVGTIIASAGITFSTAGNVAITTLNGRALGLNASVTMVNTVINVPSP
jgi:Ice-binding-like/Bacterial Ig-like domain/Bacterial Ig-like domain (group 2)